MKRQSRVFRAELRGQDNRSRFAATCVRLESAEATSQHDAAFTRVHGAIGSGFGRPQGLQSGKLR